MRYNIEKISGATDFVLFFRPTKNNKGVFSQWYPSVFSDGTYTYSTAEQYMMAQKAILMGDMETLSLILNETEPKKIKALGRKVKNFNEALWNREKYNIVLDASLLKFSQNEDLKNILLGTGNAVLVEASPYDNVWGIKMSETDFGANNPKYWKGQNLLGFALMEARYILRLLEK